MNFLPGRQRHYFIALLYSYILWTSTDWGECYIEGHNSSIPKGQNLDRIYYTLLYVT